MLAKFSVPFVTTRPTQKAESRAPQLASFGNEDARRDMNELTAFAELVQIVARHLVRVGVVKGCARCAGDCDEPGFGIDGAQHARVEMAVSQEASLDVSEDACRSLSASQRPFVKARLRDVGLMIG